MAEGTHGQILLNTQITGFECRENEIVRVEAEINGEKQVFPCDYVVSSIPLADLGHIIFGEKDEEFNLAVSDLQFRHLILVYVFVKQPLALEDQWIFFPERDLVFSRIFEQKQMNPTLGPAERTVITADFTSDEDGELWQASDDELAGRVIHDLVKAGFIAKEDVEEHLVIRSRNFYPRYGLDYEEKMNVVSQKLQKIGNLLTTGRIGMYNYNNSDHCVDMGRFIAEKLSAGIKPGEIWNALEKRVANYKIVD